MFHRSPFTIFIKPFLSNASLMLILFIRFGSVSVWDCCGLSESASSENKFLRRLDSLVRNNCRSKEMAIGKRIQVELVSSHLLRLRRSGGRVRRLRPPRQRGPVLGAPRKEQKTRYPHRVDPRPKPHRRLLFRYLVDLRRRPIIDTESGGGVPIPGYPRTIPETAGIPTAYVDLSRWHM